MKKHFLFSLLSVLVWCGALNAQLTGTKNIPGDYASLNAAILDLNSQGAGPGGVTLNLLAGTPQLAPTGGYVITVQGTAGNPIIISGNNNTITASAALNAGALNDGIFKIIGGDYITITDFVMQENPANTVTTPASNNMTEWGVALLRSTTTNGSQHNTVLANTIHLDRTYANSIAIYLNNQHTSTLVNSYSTLASTTTGPNSFNTFNGNTISNVNTPIVMNGSDAGSSYNDNQNMIINNTLTNFGGLLLQSTFQGIPGGFMYGIYIDYEINYTISDNIIQTTTSTASAEFRCIRVSHPFAGTPVMNTITRNSVSYTLQSPSGISYGIYSGGIAGANCTMNITENIIHDCQIDNTNSSTTYSIYCTTAANTVNITDNIIRNITVDGQGITYGIFSSGTTTGAININGNHIGDTNGGAVTFSNPCGAAYWPVYSLGGSATCAISISGNDFRGVTTSNTGPLTFITAGAAMLTQTISQNTFTNLSLNAGGSITLISQSNALVAGGTLTVNNNSIVGGLTITGSATSLTLFNASGALTSPPSATKTAQGNNFSNVTLNQPTQITGWFDGDGDNTNGGPSKNISNNIFSNWTCNGAQVIVMSINRAGTNSVIGGNTISGISATAGPFSPITGIIMTGTSPANSVSLSNNTISNFSGTAGMTGMQIATAGISTLNVTGNTITGFNTLGPNNVTGILQSAGSTTNYSKNKIGDLQSAQSNTIGISFSGGSNYNLSNNLIGDLRAPGSFSPTGVLGINIGNISSADLNSNTVYLNATSIGTGFGTACVHGGGNANLTMRNNLLVNLSTALGSGRTTAYRRNSGTLNLYQAASDNNSFYAGTPSSLNYIYYDGSTNDQTLAAYKTHVVSRDANSVSVNPTFASTVTSSPLFLHLPVGAANSLESGGVAITGFTTDYDNDARPGPVGSVNGWGIAPDIGADEFDGILGCTGTPTAGTASTLPAAVCGSGSFALSLSGGYSTGAGITYQWASSAVAGGPYTNVSGANAITYNTGTISTTTYYVCIITCSTSGQSIQTNEITCTVNAIPATPTASSNSPACTGGMLTLTTPTVTGATYAWSGPQSWAANSQSANRFGLTTLMAGTYSLTVTVNGCTSATGTTNVIINQTPNTPAITTSAPACEGSTLNLSTATVAGATYSWTGPAGFTSSAQNPALTNVSTSAQGNYYVTVTVNGCNSNSAPSYSQIYSRPMMLNGGPVSNSPVCSGNSLNLSVAPDANLTFSWSGPNSFTGSGTNQTLSNATTAMTGTYSVVGTSTTTGCPTNPETVNVVVNATPATPAPYSNSPVCSGNTLNFSINPVAGATYSWSGPSSFSSTLQQPALANSTTAMSGTYSLVITANGCSSAPGTTTAVVNQTPATPSPTSNSPVCSGNTLNLFGPTIAGATYTWSGGFFFSSSLQNPSIPNAISLATGTYNLTVTVNGCSSAQGSTSVVVNTTPSAPTVTSNSPVCSGNSINLSTAAITGATYSWIGPSSFSSAVQNPSRTNATTAMAGTYSLTVTTNGCTSPEGTTNVVVNATPSTPTVNIPPAICAGGNLNMNTPVVSGATYAWNGPNSFTSSSQSPFLPNATTAASGTYSVTVTTNGCTSAAGTGTTTVNPTPAAPVANSNSPVCTGNTLNLTMNTVPGASYYLWTDPTSNLLIAQNPSLANATPAMSGTYTAYVNVNGCNSPGVPVTVVVNTTPATPTASVNSPVCEGDAINLTTATASGATYTWTGPDSFSSSLQNPVLTNSTTAMSGTYSLTITSNGCTSGIATASTTVNALPVVNANATSLSVCDGTSTTLYGSGASTYAWTGSITNNVAFTPTATDTYTVTGTDVNGCVNTDVITLTVNPLPTVVANTTATTVCAGTNITLNGSGAASYSWSGSITDNVPFTATTTDTYTVTGTDANGCTDTDVISINVNALPSVIANATATTVCAGTNVTLSGSGAIFYSWSGGVNDNVPFTATATDTYTVTGTDGNGCSDEDVITVNVNALPTVIANVTSNIVCAGTPTTLSGSGAVSYSWTGNVNDNVAFNPMATDTYTVTGTDANGCTNTDELTIYVYQLPTVTASANMTTVCAGTNMMLSGGGAVSYAWTGGVQNNVIFQAASTETYTVTGTDGSGCSDTATITITVNPLPVVEANATATTVCYGTSVTLSGSGAATYNWQAMSTGVTDNVPFNAYTSDFFTVWGVDANGCVNTDTISLYVNTLPTVVASATSTAFCIGGSLTLNGSGALSYSWSGGATDNVAFTPVMSDVYIVTGTDANGCQNTDQVVVNVYPLPNVTANATATNICNGSSVTLNGSGPGVTTLTWTGGVTDNVAFTPATTDTYIVTGTDGYGCSNNDTITINVNALPSVAASATDSTVCAGSNVTLTGSGAASYSWTGSVTDNVPFTATATDTYTVTGTDANGCSNTDTITINVNALPVVTLSLPLDTACLNDGILTLSGESPAGGVWSGNNVSGTTFDPFAAGVGTHSITYTYTDVNGCQAGSTDDLYVDACAGIESIATTAWNIFPNPTNGAINITTPVELNGDVLVEVYAVDGKLIRTENIQNAKTFTLDITNEPVGTYIIKITANETTSVHRIVKI